MFSISGDAIEATLLAMAEVVVMALAGVFMARRGHLNSKGLKNLIMVGHPTLWELFGERC